MRRGTGYFALALLASALSAAPGEAADHRDGPAATADPSTDINDVYSWMSADGKTVYLAMTVFPAATTAAKFSNAAVYALHTTSRATFATMTATPTDVVCTFDQAQKISCWVGADKANYVSGDASVAAGITSKNGKVKVFAGLRDDPFFFNLDGFNKARTLVMGSAASLTFNTTTAPGCLTGPTAAIDAVVGALSKDTAGTAAGTNFFKTLNTLAIVLAVDKTLLNTGGPVMSVWAGTHAK
jgi:hypothetical protein